MDETKMYTALQRFVLSQEEYAREDFPHQGSAGTKEERTCYRCRTSYCGMAGECVFHGEAFIVTIPAAKLGAVIGRGGANLTRIQRESGAKVDIPKHATSGQSREVFLQGSAEEVEKAERMVRREVGGFGTSGKWRCCGGLARAKACSKKEGHVADENFVDPDLLVTTLAMDRPGKVFSLDCEMVKSAQGGELARVTILDVTGATCYEHLVMPPVTIGDYKTRFSGLTAAILMEATMTLKDVQKDILDLVGAGDILMGHSLRDDLRALHLEHRTVVDTVVVFPHPDGPPRKMSLRALAKNNLGRVIQAQEGQDSKEDALAVLDLMKKKVAFRM